MKKVKVAGYYIRISSLNQKEGQTIDSQRDQAERDIERNGDILQDRFRYEDEAYTGGTTQRPALMRLLNDVENGVELEVLFLTDLDRLNRDLKDQLDTLEKIQMCGVEIYLNGRPVEQTPEGELFVGQQGLFSQYRRKRIKADCLRGKRYWADKKRLIQAFAPFGYKFNGKKKDEKKILINKKEEKIVKLIFKLYLKLKSCGKVMKELKKRGIKTREGNIFGVKGVSRFLRNKAYIGEWYYFKTEAVKPKKRRSPYIKIENSGHKVRDESEWIIYDIPPIITEEVFNKVQSLLKINNKLKEKGTKFILLRGLVCCSNCSSKLYYYSSVNKYKKRYNYYLCSRNHLNRMTGREERCNTGKIDAEELEGIVWGKIEEAFRNPEILIQYMSHLNKPKKEVKMIEDDLKDLLSKKEKVKKNKRKLLELFELEDMDIDILKERMAEHTEEEKILDRSIKEKQKKLAQIENRKIIIDNLEEIIKLTKLQFKWLAPEEKRDFLLNVIDKIIFDYEKSRIEITGHIPLVKKSNLVLDKCQILR